MTQTMCIPSEISLSDPSAMAEWDAFVRSHPSGTPFHLSPWLKTIERTYRFLPVLISSRAQGGELTAIFPLFAVKVPGRRSRLISLPFSDFGGPLWAGDQGAAPPQVISAVWTEAPGLTVEVRGAAPGADRLIRYDGYVRHALDLDRDLSEIEKGIDRRTVHYSIRRAEKAGIVVRQPDPVEGMEAFCRLNALTRRKHGVPSQPKRWFDCLEQNMIRPGRGFILIAERGAEAIGAAMFFMCGTTLHYKYNASNPEVLRTVSPNHLLTWRAIQWGVEHRYRSLDFGRTARANAGLVRYKMMWGCIEEPLPYLYYPRIRGAAARNEKGFGYRALTTIWRSLPDGLAEKLSSMIYRRFA